MSQKEFGDEFMTSNKEVFVSELVKQRGIKKETAIQIVNMESALRHEMLVALRDSYKKGVNAKERKG